MNILGLAPNTKMFKTEGFLKGTFEAMHCGCEVLMDTEDIDLARELVTLAAEEAHRIEKKFSRYVSGNIVDLINKSEGRVVEVDDETALLLNFSARCYELSGGLFDITSGILRKAWKFDGKSSLPNESQVKELLALVGWNKVKWTPNQLQLQPGMEIDLGGIGKEYAVDRVLKLIQQKTKSSVLVNFGGDIAAGGPRKDGQPWRVGIEKADQVDQASGIVELKEGAIATSGDSKKFVQIGNKKLGHILNPRNGWPVQGGPRSVTVAASTCTEAGFFSTVGMLNGEQAETFLKESGVQHWCLSDNTVGRSPKATRRGGSGGL
ncbi:MAG: hypothetical protein KCHDKBKB_01400 [Elusimicrobia bacterium]|nr:hypothetical protein [Elusimicrobiota bacterium]